MGIEDPCLRAIPCYVTPLSLSLSLSRILHVCDSLCVAKMLHYDLHRRQ